MAEKVHVRIGDVKVVVAEGTLFTIGLGSCVAVALYDPHHKVGGLAHIMLPDTPSQGDERAGRVAATAVPQLLELMLEAGADGNEIFARIAGGAAMFAELLPPSRQPLGDRNVQAVHAALEQAGIPLRAEDVGGSYGRSVFLDANDGRLTIRAVQRGEWQL